MNIYRMIKIYSYFLMFFITVNFRIAAQTKIVEAFPNLNFSHPIDIQIANDNSNMLYVVSQEGIINIFENSVDVSNSAVFLDIRDRVLYGGEQGLLGLAFHPQFTTNGYFFVNYTAGNPRRSLVSRFSLSSSNINQADPNSEVILLEVDQPYSNHNGGQLSFGPDGYLYISLGDGGSGGDPGNRAQDLQTLLGKILRIDTDSEEGIMNYGIPENNPFKGNSNDYAEEIYAHGLRNVWRFSFDSYNRLWAADVGQNEWEEINIIENGGNYGWRIMEGNHCFNPSINCDQNGLILPIWEYPHNSGGGYSITGGYLYEGMNAPDLFNKYVYADYVTGNIWALNPLDSSNSFIDRYSGNISTFGVDQDKDLYFADYDSGSLFKLIDDNINSVNDPVPSNFKLFQNFPNPFNPVTVIRYYIPTQSEIIGGVTIKVFDALGREIEILADNSNRQGMHEIFFDGSDLSGGVYYYQIQYGDLVENKKMILLK